MAFSSFLDQRTFAQLEIWKNNPWNFSNSAVVPARDRVEPLPTELSLFAEQPFTRVTDQSERYRDRSLASYHANGPLAMVEPSTSQPSTLAARLLRDQVNFYSPESLLLLGSGLGVGAIVANSNMDDAMQRHIHSSLQHANSDDWLKALHANKELGEGRFTLPIFAGAWVVGSLLPESQFSERTRTWGERTLRGFVVGAPPVILLQHATGGSRPGESPRGSEWQPFADNNGVSGHAFMGALPFITAAKMTDHLALKTTLYAASTLGPLSRTSDGAHYPSQVAIGWGIAFLAASAVTTTDDPRSRLRVFPTFSQAGSGMALEYRY